MSVTVKTENSLKERMFIYTLSSGAKCYIIPKYGFSQKQAAVIFRYGSCDINLARAETKFRIRWERLIFWNIRCFKKRTSISLLSF